jgi:hypothetical protein
MRGVFQNLIGIKSGRLTVIDGPFRIKKRGGSSWLCKCDCGKTLVNYIGSSQITRQTTKSCGCLLIDRVKASNTTHGLTKTRTYTSWKSMWQRCTDKSHKSYEYYKTRTPVDRWKSFEMFLLDMGERPSGMSLERIDNSKPYSPENCRWATNRDQQLNRDSTIVLFINGIEMSMREACMTLGTNYNRAKARVRNGWTPHDAVTKPKSNRWGYMNAEGIFVKES